MQTRHPCQGVWPWDDRGRFVTLFFMAWQSGFEDTGKSQALGLFAVFSNSFTRTDGSPMLTPCIVPGDSLDPALSHRVRRSARTAAISG